MKPHSFLLIASILLVAGCGRKEAPSTKMPDDVIPVKVMPVQATRADAEISASGQFTTDDEVLLSFKTGGVIDRTYAKEGDLVQKGQLLAALKLTEIDAQVEQAKLALEKAKRDYDRVSRLYADSVATLEQFQNAKTGYDMATQQLTAAQFNRSYSEIRATESGYILRKMANDGSLVGPGTPVYLLDGAKSSAWLLKAGVSDRQWENISVGDKAQITTDASTAPIEGAVYRKSHGADPATGLMTVDIKLNGGKLPGLGYGMFGKATIQTKNAGAAATNQWYLPYEAVLDADGANGFVFAVNDSTATKVKVTIAGMSKDRVIISDGLQNVKAIVVTGSAYLKDNSRIKVIQ